MATTEYISVAELKATLKISHTNSDADLARAAASASRMIDKYCNDQFYLSDSYEKYYRAEYPDVLEVRSFASAVGTTIEFDADDDGTFEITLADTDWQGSPIEREPDEPFYRIELLGGKVFPGAWRSPYYSYYPTSTAYGYGFGWNGVFISRRPRIRVTTQWGWPEVPEPISQAAQIIAISLWKSKDVTGGVAGSTAMATGAFGAKRDILLNPSHMDGLAKDLLRPYRRMVVA